MRNFKPYIEKSILWLLIFLFWYIGTKEAWWSAFIVPPPERVAQSFFTLLSSGMLWKHIYASMSRVLAGFSLAFLLAFPLGLLLGTQARLYRIASPVLEFFRHVPPLAMLPMIILWFGIGEASKLLIVILATFFPIFLNTAAGIHQYDPKLEEAAVVFGLPARARFIRLRLPQAFPYIWVGIRLGLGYSWRSLIGAEMIAAASGIGYMILDGEQMARPDIVILGILVIGAAGILIDALLCWGSCRWLPYTRKGNPHA